MLHLPIKKLCLSAPRSRSGVFLVKIASTYDFLSIFYIFYNSLYTVIIVVFMPYLPYHIEPLL